MIVRVVSALAALPAVLWLIYEGGWYFGALVLLVAARGLYEFCEMMLRDRLARALFTSLGTLMILVALTGGFSQVTALLAVACLPLFTVVYFLTWPGDFATTANRAAFGLMAIFWVAAPLATMGLLRQLPEGGGWVLLACALAWGSDSGAYFVGRAFGRHLLYPQISPKKTWEGSIAGLLTGPLIGAAVIALVGPKSVDFVHLATLGPLAAACGQAGDLGESLLKRSVGVKDSGQFMPGHGGLLDRIDALLFVGPLVLAYAYFVADLHPAWLSLGG